ncbi:MAG: phytoene desaturase [Bacteroidales bacterium]|nr:phytoene desaturase [Bacteroidales bacterium]
MNRKKISIIGTGFSGLSAAAALSYKGFDVDVFEKNSLPGGRARKLEEKGYRFDMGPTWYWMPEVFEKFFNLFGKTVSDFYEIRRVDPGYRMYFGVDDYVDVPADMEKLLQTFESIEPGAAEKLRKFLLKAEFKYNIGINQLVYLPGNSYLELMRWDLIKGMLKLDFFKSVSTYVRQEFKDPRLRQILEFPVIFLGATPQKTPALYTLMNYADLSLGTWYPVRGMYSVVEGMKKVAEDMGAKFHLDARVESILMNGDRASGLRVNGQEISSDAIVAAADYHHVEQQLLPGKYRRYNENYWDKRVMAPSSLLFYLGLDKKLTNFEHHNLFFDEDFIGHAEQIYDNPQWPSNPAIYVSNNTVTDPSVAPKGHDNLIILIPVAPGLEDNEATREKYFDLVMERLEKITRQEIKKHVVYKRAYAHNDFLSDYNSYKGNAYGLANTLWQTANFKPRMKSKVKNLFFTGQLTVPGPGVPPTIISGQVVAGQVEKIFK